MKLITLAVMLIMSTSSFALLECMDARKESRIGSGSYDIQMPRLSAWVDGRDVLIMKNDDVIISETAERIRVGFVEVSPPVLERTYVFNDDSRISFMESAAQKNNPTTLYVKMLTEFDEVAVKFFDCEDHE